MKIKISRNYGFTLVELIVTVAVLAIIVSMAYPSIMTHLANMEAKRLRYDILNTLKIARAESYIRRKDLLLCLSNDGKLCNRDSDKILLLFIDENDDKNFNSETDYLIEKQALNPKYSTLALRVGVSRHYTKFWGDSGKPRGHYGHIKYCPTTPYNQNMYQLSFNEMGIFKYKPNEKEPTKCGT